MKKICFPKFSEKMKRRFMISACAVLMIFMSVMAYFTSTEQVTNRFTVGEVKIDLVEPNWPGNADPAQDNNVNIDTNGDDHSFSDANYILPGELVPKDPKIVNTGKNEAIVFMKVEMPVYTDVQGNEHELFVVSSHAVVNNATYNTDVTPVYKFSDLQEGNALGGEATNWIYMGKAEGEDHTYIFGYTKMLYPESTDKHIKDNEAYSTSDLQDTPTPFQTQNLFNYVMLNPELNSIEPDEGGLYTVTKDENGYVTSRTPIPQDINIYAYAIQAESLSADIQGIEYDSTELSKAWEIAGFGELANSSIPDAQGHNKYGIPAENYADANSNPWTEGSGSEIVNNSKSIENLNVTYHYTVSGTEETSVVVYKRLSGSNTWVGWIDNTNGVTYKATVDATENVSDLSNYLNTLSAGTADIWASWTEDKSSTDVTSASEVKTVNVKFAKSGTFYTSVFTKIGSESYELTSGVGTLPDAGTGKGWYDKANPTIGDTAISGDIATYLNNLATEPDNNATITLYAVTTPTEPEP